MTNIRRLRDRIRSARNAGAVATEFALLMAFFPMTVLAFGVVDYGEIMAQAANLYAIVRGAADYVRGQVVQGNALPTAANLNTLTGVPSAVFPAMSCPDGSTNNPCQFCTCADGSHPSPLPACPALGSNTDNPCAQTGQIPANGDTRVLVYNMVSGSQNYTPFIGFSGKWTTVPGSVKARTVFRTQ
jgi:hypothetical protein